MKKGMLVFIVVCLLAGGMTAPVFGADAADAQVVYFDGGAYAVWRTYASEEVAALLAGFAVAEAPAGRAVPAGTLFDRAYGTAAPELSLLSGVAAFSGVSPQAFAGQSGAVRRQFAGTYDYYDAAGRKLWTLALTAVYDLTPVSAVCVSADTLYKTFDGAWSVVSSSHSYSGSFAFADFTLKKYVGFVPTATVQKQLSLCAMPQGVYKGDPTAVKKGDLNADGYVRSSDARLALRIVARLDTATAAQFIAADVDGDGRVSSADARTILRAAARLKG